MSTTATEQNIINLLQQQDKQAINLLYKHYANSLYGVILKVVQNEAIAQDALQETFVKVWKNSSKYNPEKAKLFTWLFRIAKNTAIDKLRSYNKRFHKEIQINTTNVYMLPTACFNQEVMDIQQHVNSLKDKYKVVINALYFEGLTQQEASEALQIPLGTVKSRVKIALRELKKIYDV